MREVLADVGESRLLPVVIGNTDEILSSLKLALPSLILPLAPVPLCIPLLRFLIFSIPYTCRGFEIQNINLDSRWVGWIGMIVVPWDLLPLGMILIRLNHSSIIRELTSAEPTRLSRPKIFLCLGVFCVQPVFPTVLGTH